MQSKTSSFEGLFSPALYRKDLGRFWPLWAVYGAVWLLALPASSFLILFGDHGSWQYADRVDSLLWVVSDWTTMAMIMALVFGCLLAMALFSYLDSPRSVGFAHALPLRREGHFLTHCAAGLTMFLSVHLLTLGLTAAVWAAGGVPQLGVLWNWFLIASGEALFFFSLAVFCALFAGQVLAVPVFYAALNGLAWFLTVMCQSLGEAFFYGYSSYGVPAAVEWLTPVFGLGNSVGPNYGSGRIINPGDDILLGFNGLGVVGLYTLAGLVLLAAALAVNRYRRSESAGEIVAVGWARPLFRYGVALCAALSLGQLLCYLLSESFGNYDVSAPAMAVCMILTGLLGYYAAEMLLQKSFRVFKKSWKGAVILSAALVLVCAGFALDFFGVANRVPDPAKVETLQFNLYGSGNSGLNGDLSTLDGQDDGDAIAAFTELHRAVVSQGRTPAMGWNGEDDSYYLDLTLTYSLKNGQTLRRSYAFDYTAADLENPDSLASQAAVLLSDPKIQLSTLTPLEDLQRITGGSLDLFRDYSQEQGWYNRDSLDLSAGEAQTLADAFYADVAAGAAGRDFLNPNAWEENTYVNELSIYYLAENPDGSTYSDVLYLYFSRHYTRLLSALEGLGFPLDRLHTYAQLREMEAAAQAGETDALSGVKVGPEDYWRGEGLPPDDVYYENPASGGEPLTLDDLRGETAAVPADPVLPQDAMNPAPSGDLNPNSADLGSSLSVIGGADAPTDILLTNRPAASDGRSPAVIGGADAPTDILVR